MFKRRTYYQRPDDSARGWRDATQAHALKFSAAAAMETQGDNELSFTSPKYIPSDRTCVGFVDVVGFSQMMQSDEDRTYQRWVSLRSEILVPLLKKHDGQLVKSMGDGLLVTFKQAANGVRWVRDVQMQSRRRRHGLMLRAALNYCRVLRDEGDLIGDGVNIAARLQEHAPAGGALLTDSVREQIADLIAKLEHKPAPANRSPIIPNS